MRLLIDLQPYQGVSKYRGIGRYSISLTKAIARNNKTHDIFILLNSVFIDSVEQIKEELYGLIPKKNIITYFIPKPNPISYIDPANYINARISTLIREYTISEIRPDIVHINSLFENDVVTSVKEFDKNTITSVTLHDLIPLAHRSRYLNNTNFKSYYFQKLKNLKMADALLAISNYSKHEAIKYLNINEDKIFTIYNGCDDKFKKIEIDKEEKNKVLRKYGIRENDRFILYVPGGFDVRKNVDGLIKAYSRLPSDIKNKFKLTIASKTDNDDKVILEKLIRDLGLQSNIIITGYVSDEDLVKLYNLCDLFVFPSIHEGFGLPIVEAMACGAPVIASNTTSIPEVLGREDALFDPYDIDSIAFKIKKVLANENFRNELREYGLERVKNFSWDNSAKKAIEVFEYIYNKSQKKTISVLNVKKPKLAYISPLPPEKSGISSYSRELLPYLSKYYDIETIVDQDKVDDGWILRNIPIRNVDYFKKNYKSYDRVLYHIGNSPFHKHMLFLLEDYPGAVVLHDFYLSGLYFWMEANDLNENFFTNELYNSHGYFALKFLKENGFHKTIFEYPLNAYVLQNALGIITHSEFSKDLAQRFYSINNFENWHIIKHIKRVDSVGDKSLSRKILDIKDDDFIICSFGIIGMTKLNHRLLQAFAKSDLSRKDSTKLIFVGENEGDYGKELLENIEKLNLKDKVFITGWADDNAYRHYLSACDIAVQLRTLSRGESSRAVLDCLASGIPTIVNAHGTMADFPKDIVYMLDDKFKDEELIEALEELYYNEEKRKVLGFKAKEYIKEFHHPEKIAIDYQNVIENLYSKPSKIDLLERVSIYLKSTSEEDLIKISSEISKNLNPKPRLKQMFIDITSLIKTDSQKMLKSQLKNLLEKPIPGYRVEPIYLDNVDGKWIYKYAREFTANFIDINLLLDDEPIDIFEGDLLYVPELHPILPEIYEQGLFSYMKAKNVQISFMVHNILPLISQDYFPEHVYKTFNNLINVMASYADKLICVSKSLEEEIRNYLHKNNLLNKSIQITHIYPGFEIAHKFSDSVDVNDLEVFYNINQKPYFLVNSSIEPWKGHEQVLKAFEILWERGYDFNLVFLGNKVYKMEDFIVNYIEKHPQKDKKIFWLSYISDDLTKMFIENAKAAILASEYEGFDFSILEYAYYKTPIIARDIPVFREIAKDGAYYFPNTKDEKVLANSILEWYSLYRENKHPKPDSIKWMSWQEHTEKLKEIILS